MICFVASVECLIIGSFNFFIFVWHLFKRFNNFVVDLNWFVSTSSSIMSAVGDGAISQSFHEQLDRHRGCERPPALLTPINFPSLNCFAVD